MLTIPAMPYIPLSPAAPIDRHPLLAMRDWRMAGNRCALATIVKIDGTSPRTVGAQMAVREDGEICGYFTGGCLETELAEVAKRVMSEGQNRLHRYGKGSPFIDIKLPCGAGIDVYFDQALEDSVVFQAARAIEERELAGLRTDLETGRSRCVAGNAWAPDITQTHARDGVFEKVLKPAPRLHVFGSGSAAVQMAFIAHMAGLPTALFAGDDLTANLAGKYGLPVQMIGAQAPSLPSSDPWTASILAFHEHEKEIPILTHLARFPGFFVGAVGSKTVSLQRRADLAAAGLTNAEIDRVEMRVGHVRSARTATELAVGVLSQILDTARQNGLAN